jgi:hypothetical protein
MAVKRPTYTTPKGLASYPWLNTPDTKFSPDGDFKVTLLLSATDGQPVIDFLNEQLLLSAQLAKKENAGKKIKVADAPYKQCEETGDVSITFKLKALVNMKNGDSFTQKPALFDSQLKPITANVGGGSTIRVSYECNPFYTSMIGAGISLRLKAVQVLDLQEFSSGATGSAMGFEKEDGFKEVSPAQGSGFAKEEEETDEDDF